MFEDGSPPDKMEFDAVRSLENYVKVMKDVMVCLMMAG